MDCLKVPKSLMQPLLHRVSLAVAVLLEGVCLGAHANNELSALVHLP